MNLEKAQQIANLSSVVVTVLDKILQRIDEKFGEKAKIKKLEEENAELKKKLENKNG